MSITEAQRHQLYLRLEATLGEEEAQVLMEHLPPVGWADVATKRDLDRLETVLRSDMATLSSDMRGDMTTLASDLRGDMATLSSNLRGEMSTLASDLRGEMKALGGDIRTDMATLRADLMAAQRNRVFALVGAMTALLSVALVVLRFS